jgi:hypothetical protein
MKNLKVALSFTRLTDGDLSAFTNTVITNMTSNTAFAKPPVALADLTKLREAFDAAVSAAMDGGTTLKAARNAAREELLTALRKLAAYVQIVAVQDEALLLSSGFSPVNTGVRTQGRLDVPLILFVDNAGTTRLCVRLQPVNNARSYEVRATNGATTPAASVLSTQARRVIVGNLTPGTTYNIQARAIGGSEGCGDWSDPVSHMAI